MVVLFPASTNGAGVMITSIVSDIGQEFVAVSTKLIDPTESSAKLGR